MSLKLTINPKDVIERAWLDADLDQMEGEWVIEMRKLGKRTSPQNRFYHGVIVKQFTLFMRQQGQPWTTEQCHQVLAAKHLTVTELVGDVFVERVKSTTELSVEEMSEYIENCIVWLSEQFGIVVPEPGDMSISAA